MATPSQSLSQIQFDPGATVSTNGRPLVDIGSLPLLSTLVHTPATNTQATVTRPGVPGYRTVCRGITATLAAGATAIAAAAPILVNLRDGATGAGTILWSSYINVPAVASQAVTINVSTNIVGSVNTAMTLEFAAGGGTNSYESVALTYLTTS